MIALFRLIILMLFVVLVSVFGSIYCLFSPRNPRHVYTFSRMFPKLAALFGFTLEVRIPEEALTRGQQITIGNHQNNWDMVTISAGVTPNVVTVGKKSLLWIPFFGPFYWLTGNILLDRENKSKAMNTINQVVEKMEKSNLSVWMFPEGTRSKGRGLLPFKVGAFRTAILAQVPIVPIVCSSTDNIKLNRWNNGHVIVEMLDPISVEGLKKEDAKELMIQAHTLMKEKLESLDEEVAAINRAEN